MVTTGIGLMILFAISRWMWGTLHEVRPSRIFKLLIIYLTYTPIHNLIIFAVNRGGRLFRFQVPFHEDVEKYHQGLHYVHLTISSIIITLCIGLKLRFRYRLTGMAILFFVNWAINYFPIFVPRVAEISAYHLILVSIIVVPMLMVLFRIAKLDYLFP